MSRGRISIGTIAATLREKSSGYQPVGNEVQRPDWLRFFGINLIFFLAYFSAFIYIFRGSSTHGILYSPASSAIEYETREIDTSMTTPFTREPGPESDAAWDQLLRYNNVVVSEEELHKLNATSVQLRDKSGYLATLDVFHELHCLDYIRRSAFADYYQLDVAHRKYEHILHCLDHIRAVLMCHGDTTVRTFEWIKTAHYPVLKPKTTRQCRRWEPIVEWAKSRYPSHENGPILEHPKYGIINPTMSNITQEGHH